MKNANSKKKSVIELNKKIDMAPGKIVEQVLPLTGQKVYYSNFEVRPAGNTNEIYPPKGYSKYMARWTAFRDGKLKFPQQIYGLEQALEHIDELRKSITNGKYTLIRAKFEVVEVTIIKTAFKTKKS